MAEEKKVDVDQTLEAVLGAKPEEVAEGQPQGEALSAKTEEQSDKHEKLIRRLLRGLGSVLGKVFGGQREILELLDAHTEVRHQLHGDTSKKLKELKDLLTAQGRGVESTRNTVSRVDQRLTLPKLFLTVMLAVFFALLAGWLVIGPEVDTHVRAVKLLAHLEEQHMHTSDESATPKRRLLEVKTQNPMLQEAVFTFLRLGEDRGIQTRFGAPPADRQFLSHWLEITPGPFIMMIEGERLGYRRVIHLYAMEDASTIVIDVHEDDGCVYVKREGSQDEAREANYRDLCFTQ